jgi:hypothetical protein
VPRARLRGRYSRRQRGLSGVLKTLFPDGIIDRSVLWGISGTSSCWSDGVAFLTGAGLQYGNLATSATNATATPSLLYLEDTQVVVVKKAGGNPTPYQVDLMRYYQWAHANDILSHPLEDSYQTKLIPKTSSSRDGSIRRLACRRPLPAAIRG